MGVLRRVGMMAVAAALAAVLVPSLPALADNDGGVLLRASVSGSLPSDPALFGANPGGAPWVIDRSEVRVTEGGNLFARVRALVIPRAPFNGTNPVPML